MGFIHIKDQRFNFLVISEQTLGELNSLIKARVEVWNAQPTVQGNDDHKLFCFYTIRADGHGSQTQDFADLLTVFQTARRIERIIFHAESPLSIRTNHQFGPLISVPLDGLDRNRLTAVSGDNKDWVSATFSELETLLTRQRSYARYIQTPVTGLLIQLFGTTAAVLLSLWAAEKLHTAVQNVEYPKLVVFALVFLVLSNLWPYAAARIGAAFAYVFPNVQFQRTNGVVLPMVLRILFEAALAGFFLWLLGQLGAWALKVLSPFIKP